MFWKNRDTGKVWVKIYFLNGHMGSGTRAEEVWYKVLKTYMVTPRRSSYTASNTNKRLTLANLLPQKRRLEDIMNRKNLKKSKLFNI